MVILVVIAVLIALYWVGCLIIGTPLVVFDTIRDYRNNRFNKKKKNLYKIAFILWTIVSILVSILLWIG